MNTRIIESLKLEKTKLEKQIAEDEATITALPNGDLHVYPRQDGYNWYVTGDGNSKKRTYLPKSQKDKAEQLAQKGYVQARLRENKENLRAINAYLQKCNKKPYSELYIQKNSEIGNLVGSQVKQDDTIVNNWQSQKYIGPQKYPEHLTINTKAGFPVRSKSEKSIVAHLYDRGIPFKYEDRLHANGYDILPDFTIMNPRTHKIFIWEHFGKMDDYAYRRDNMPKIETYAQLGYHLGNNLIMTFEVKNSDIDEDLIDFYIENYLT